MSLLNTFAKRLVSRPTFNRSLVTRQCLTGNRPKSQKRLYSSTEPKKPIVSPSHNAFTWKSAVVLGITAAGLVVYFRNEKEKLQLEKEKREREKIKRLGKPNIGSPFKLYNVNEDRIQSSEELMKDKFTLLYFGFTHCPDICPEELDKMSEVVDLVKEEYGNIIQPVFITCDPLRDTKEVVKEYVKDFHPDLIGFTGSPEELKRVARSYRVYTYTPPNVTEKDDYLVDHSIFFYLMDPEGKFVDCYARDKTTEEVYHSFKNYLKDYQ